jgi:uncharacterized protein YndB with AHSA1/START domain
VPETLASLELVIVRHFKATREAVWSALTEQDQVTNWTCPVGFIAEWADGDLRPGGAWRSVMRMPGGPAFESDGEYIEVHSPAFLKYTHCWKNEDGSYKPTTEIVD